jgi:SAM-dependent methyltransferase
MEYINCNLCGLQQDNLLYSTKDKNWILPGEFNLVQCRKCGLAYINPRPDETEIKQYYPKRYYLRLGAAEFTQEYIKIMEKSFQARLRLIQRFKKSGRLLEIGCGDGHFLRYLKERGYEVFGLDTSEFAVSLAQENVGKPQIFKGQIFEARYPEGFFDVICLFEVLEHLHNPASVLKEARRTLKNGGILVITVPNFASLERIILGDCWYGVDAPRHLYHFTKKTLRLILEKSGFTILSLDIVNSHQINEVGINTGYSEGIRVKLRDYGLYPKRTIPKDINEIRPKKDGNSLKKWLHIFEKIIFSPLVLIAEIFQSGGTLIAVAKKIICAYYF